MPAHSLHKQASDSATTLSIKGLHVRLSICDTQHNDTQHQGVICDAQHM
jgi:hypothetical protein